MKINITGQGITLGEYIKKHIHASLENSLSQIINLISEVNIVVQKNGHHIFHCSAIVDINDTTIVIKSDGEDEDIFTACDQCCAKIKKQLRRYHKKIVEYRHKKDSQGKKVELATYSAKKYTVNHNDMFNYTENPENHIMSVMKNISEEKVINIDHLSKDEAVMKMDLSNVYALPFIDVETHNVCVVCKKEDDKITILDLGYKAK